MAFLRRVFWASLKRPATRENILAEAAADFAARKASGEVRPDAVQLVVDHNTFCSVHRPPPPHSKEEVAAQALVVSALVHALLRSPVIHHVTGGDITKIQKAFDDLGCPLCLIEALKAKEHGKLH